MQLLGTVMVSAALASGTEFAQSHDEVAGMSQYTDRGFGISFWYPTAWKVTETPASTDRSAWFRGARIVKELRIENPRATEINGDEPPGVTGTELITPSEGLTELGETMSASPVGMDVRYYFDDKSNRWMMVRLSEGPDERGPGVEPLDITSSTMGGLPIINGAERHGAEVVVPLSPTRFVAVSTMDPGGHDSHLYLAQTIVAAKAGAGRRADAKERAETIRVEAEKLGAIRQ